jgi:Rieske Fe-S protein
MGAVPGASLAGLCLPGLLGGCAGLVYVTPAVDGDRLVVERTTLAERRFVLVQHPYDDRPIYLHRHDSGAFTAVSTRCAHQGCQVEPAGDRLACPCHGSEYTLDGVVVKSPAERNLRRFGVTADVRRIFIELENRDGS